MNKRGFMFTLAAVFLVMVILIAFLIQASNITKTNIETSSIRTKTTDSFLNSLVNSYLPDALEIAVRANPTTPDLSPKIYQIQEFASRTGINFNNYEISGLTSTLDPVSGGYDAQFTITIPTITNQEVTYQDITETIKVEDIIIT